MFVIMLPILVCKARFMLKNLVQAFSFYKEGYNRLAKFLFIYLLYIVQFYYISFENMYLKYEVSI